MKMALPLPLLASPAARTRPRLAPGGVRGVAIFWGVLFLVGTATRAANPQIDLGLWWLDLRTIPGIFAMTFTGLGGLSMLSWGLIRRPGVILCRITFTCASLGAAAAAINAAIVLGLFASGRLQGAFPVPASLLIAASFGLVAWNANRQSSVKSDDTFPLLGALALCTVGFPVLQVFCFGWTDYQRLADVAVVFGARAYADGTPSEALGDRVQRACELYKHGRVSRLYFSGGPGDGAIHETESMRRMALDLGVPDSAITADLTGLNTEATVRHSLEFAHTIHAQTILAVSEFYHLPRIKLCYQGHGAEVYTVPAHPSDGFRAWPLFSIVREVPAYWTYFAKAAAHSSKHSTITP